MTMCYRELYGLLDLHAYPHNIKYVEIYILYILLLSLIRMQTTRQSSSAIKTLTGNEIMELKSRVQLFPSISIVSFFFFLRGGGRQAYKPQYKTETKCVIARKSRVGFDLSWWYSTLAQISLSLWFCVYPPVEWEERGTGTEVELHRDQERL